jgi:hypothetical protein
MARRRPSNLRYAILAVVISVALWGLAHGGTPIERGFDVPIVFKGLPADLVITEQSSDEINVRVQGTQAALRNLSPNRMEYAVNVSGGKPGRAEYEVDVSQLDMPRGVRIVARSPAQLEVRMERRGRKNVKVRPDLEGQPADGYELGDVTVDPPRVWLAGARSIVLRLGEAVTEPIDISGATAPVDREVKLSFGTDHVWMEEDKPVKVRIDVHPVPPPTPAPAPARGARK